MSIGRIELSNNENSYGCSPKAASAALGAAADISRYPDLGDRPLREAIAAYHRLDPDRIICGSGCWALLQLVAHTVLGPGQCAVMSAASFRGFELVTLEAGGKAIKSAEVNDRPSLKGLTALARHAAAIFIANPDNPSGTLFSRDGLLELITAVPRSVMVVVDEAYIEYSAPDGGVSLLHDVDANPNLLVLRSFSKAYGLAGARLGWLYSHHDWSARALLQRIPHRLSGQGIAAGIAALGDRAFMADCVERNRVERERLRDGLTRLGLASLSSSANFLAVDARAIPDAAERLHSEGVEVRDLTLYDKPGWLRITVGTADENAALLTRLAHIAKRHTE